MDAATLEKLERIARNFPCQEMDYIKEPTKWGEVYIAIGRGVSSDADLLGFTCWHGVYSIPYGTQQMARSGEVAGSCSKKVAIETFLGDAVWFLRHFEERNMLDESFKLGHA